MLDKCILKPLGDLFGNFISASAVPIKTALNGTGSKGLFRKGGGYASYLISGGKQIIINCPEKQPTYIGEIRVYSFSDNSNYAAMLSVADVSANFLVKNPGGLGTLSVK